MSDPFDVPLACIDKYIAVKESEKAERRSRVINRDYVRRWALDYCTTHAMPSKRKKTRCSEQFLNMIEAATKSAIIHRIESHTSKGATLQ